MLFVLCFLDSLGSNSEEISTLLFQKLCFPCSIISPDTTIRQTALANTLSSRNNLLIATEVGDVRNSGDWQFLLKSMLMFLQMSLRIH